MLRNSNQATTSIYCELLHFLGLFLRKIQLVWLEMLDGRFSSLTQSYVSSTTTIKVAKIAVAFLQLLLDSWPAS